MNGVTDHPCRHIQKKYGRPMLLFTEFTSVDGICAGASTLLTDFDYDESQRPIIGQIYGRDPDKFRQTAILLCQLGFDGIDINMGCPAKSVANGGAGAGLIRTPDLAQAIVRATLAGVQQWVNGATVRDCPDVTRKLAAAVEARASFNFAATQSGGGAAKLNEGGGALPPAYQARRAIPVSVKTRIGYAAPQVAEWIPRLLETGPAAITVHGRTLAQGYTGVSDWAAIGQAAALARGSGTLVLGNGDLRDLADAQTRSATYGTDGALIGRASYGNPFVFRDDPATLPPVPGGGGCPLGAPRLKDMDGHARVAEEAPPAAATPVDPAVHHVTAYGGPGGGGCPLGAPRLKTVNGSGAKPDYRLLHIALEHAQLYDAHLAQTSSGHGRPHFLPMRKHLGWYVRHLPGASHLRRTLLQSSSLADAVAAIHAYLDYRRAWDN
jgi:tRNA-dihydrouridine synthase B